MALGDQRVEGPHDVVGGDRRAVLEARFAAQREGDPAAVFRVFDALGDQPIGGQRLVEAAGQQAVIERAILHEVVAVLGEAVALEGEGVEVVESADRRRLDRAAFRRVWVDVCEMREVGGIFQRIVIACDAVAGDRIRRPGQRREGAPSGNEEGGEQDGASLHDAPREGGGARRAGPNSVSSIVSLSENRAILRLRQGPRQTVRQPASTASAAACTRRSPAARTRPSEARPSFLPCQSVKTPPAPSMIGTMAQ